MPSANSGQWLFRNGLIASASPSLFDEYWQPIIQACAETETVISLHVGSSGIADGRVRRPWRWARPCRTAVVDRVRRMVMVGVGRSVPRVEDRHVGRWYRVGGHAARPARQHH